MTKKETIDTCGTDEVICPYCGFEYGASLELGDSFYGCDEECERCGEEFEFYSDVSITYRSYKKEEGESKCSN